MPRLFLFLNWSVLLTNYLSQNDSVMRFTVCSLCAWLFCRKRKALRKEDKEIWDVHASKRWGTEGQIRIYSQQDFDWADL